MKRTTFQPPNEVFFQIWHKFTANIGSLWLYSQQIPEMADKLDQDKVREIAYEMADIFNDDPKEIEEELLEFLPALNDLDIYPNFYENPNVRETFQLFKSNDFKEHVLEWAIKNLGKAQKLVHVITTYFAEPPANGVILRRSALVTLLTFLEILFEDLFYVFYYYVKPDGTLEKEESRGKAAKIQGWKNRIKSLKGFGITLGPLELYLDEFYEIVERRNRIVHGDGIVTKKYLENAPNAYQPDDVKEGQILIVSTRYLIRAFHIITLLAFQVCQNAWRQWRPRRSAKKANEAFERFVFSMLKQNRYDLVCDLAFLSDEFKLASRYRQFVIVNHAIALREQNKIEQVMEKLSELQGEKREWRVNIAYAILKEDYSKAQQFLLQAAWKNKLLDISRYWPLFDPIREEQWFKNVFDGADRGTLPQNKKRFK